MGNVIDQNASAADILKDVRTTRAACDALGGVWAAEGVRFLDDVLRLADRVADDRKVASAAAIAARTARNAELARAHAVVGSGHDRIWNLIGRGRHDPYLALLYVGGVSTADGPMDRRAPAMEHIATLLETVGHPQVDPAVTAAIAAELRAEAALVTASLAADATAASREDGLSRTFVALARIGQIRLSALKKALLAHGFRQTQVHEVIPDHPRSKADDPVPPPD